MASLAQVHYPHTVENHHHLHPVCHISPFQLPKLTNKKPLFTSLNSNFSSLKSNPFNFNSQPLLCGASGGGNHGSNNGGNNGGHGGGKSDEPPESDTFGPIAALINGWKSRVKADPQFPFKLLMEELVGVSAAVLGDMASRPNFGLNELDFVFSTLVVGSILNFTLMYLLAPTTSSSSIPLPSIFSNSPTSHMFEPGSYTLINRLGTLVYKGTVFAVVGLGAGLLGTALSNGLIKMRKKLDPNFESPNKPPPMILNGVTWAIHMGGSSNLRYQTLNGIEFLLQKGLPPVLFRTSVVGLRLVNNVLGGSTFVMLARLTGSQSSGPEKKVSGDEDEDEIEIK